MEDEFDGWGNAATQHYQMVVWNDRNLLGEMDHCLKQGLLASLRDIPTIVRQLLPSFCMHDDIDIISIIIQRAAELLKNGEISETRYNLTIRRLRAATFWEKPRKIRDRLLNTPTTISAKADTKDEEKKTMAKIVDIKHVTYVNGEDVSTLKTAEKVALLAHVESSITSLKAVKVKSKMIDKEVAGLEKDLAALVELFDKDIVQEEGK